MTDLYDGAKMLKQTTRPMSATFSLIDNVIHKLFPCLGNSTPYRLYLQQSIF